MNGADLFTYCYNISVVALSECLVLPNTSSAVFNNLFNVMVFTFLRKNFAGDITWCFFEILVLLKSQRYIHIGFIVEKCTIINFGEGKKF